MKVSRLVAAIFCAIGFYWQLHLICEQYFEYGVTSLILTGDNVQIVPPSLAIYIDRDSSLLENHSYTLNEINSVTPSINQIVPEMLLINYTAKSMGKPGVISGLRSDEHQKVIDELLERHKFVAIIRTVLNILYTFTYRSDLVRIRTAVTPWTFIVAKFLNTKHSIKLFSTKSGVYGRGQQMARIKLLNQTDLVHVYYDYSAFQLLPAPYKTKCVDYQNLLGCQSREKCIEICISNSELNQFETLASDIHYEMTNLTNIGNSSMGQYRFFGLNEESNYKSRFNKMLRSIAHTCHRKYVETECIDQSYHNLQVSAIAEKGQPSSSYQLRTMPSSSAARFITIALPVVSLTDFVVYIMSVVSFWLTVSPYDLMEWFIRRMAEKINGDQRPSNRSLINMDIRSFQRRLDRVETLFEIVNRMKVQIRKLKKKTNRRFDL